MTATAEQEAGTTADLQPHSHVLAVQDWGGSQEWWRGWDDRWTRGQAEQHARDMVRADSLWWDQQGQHPDATGTLDREFGDRWHELVSTNLCPGWNAIWIIGCADPCGWSADDDPGDGPPWWPAAAEGGSLRRHLRLVAAS